MKKWYDHSPRARQPGMWSQEGLRKHHYEMQMYFEFLSLKTFCKNKVGFCMNAVV